MISYVESILGSLIFISFIKKLYLSLNCKDVILKKIVFISRCSFCSQSAFWYANILMWPASSMMRQLCRQLANPPRKITMRRQKYRRWPTSRQEKGIILIPCSSLWIPKQSHWSIRISLTKNREDYCVQIGLSREPRHRRPRREDRTNLFPRGRRVCHRARWLKNLFAIRLR